MRGALLSGAACVIGGNLCLAREVVHLKSGFSLNIDSHHVENGRVVVSTAGGTLEFSALEVQEIEQIPDEKPAAPAAPAAPASGPNTETVDSVLQDAALQQGLLPDFVHSVAKVESGLNPKAVSPKGAIGLMQLMPSTAAELGTEPRDAAGNALGGAKYLRQLLLQYHGNAALALAAYNAGPAAVERYHGIPPYPETRRYIVRVLKELAAAQAKHPHALPNTGR